MGDRSGSVVGATEATPVPATWFRAGQTVRGWAGRRCASYGAAVAAVALVTVAIGLVPSTPLLGQRSPIYLIAVLGTGALFGRGPAIAAAVLSFLAFDW